MKITSKKFDVKRFQQGGEMAPAPESAPEAAPAPEQAPEQGGDPLEQIVMAAAQALQTQDAQLALQVCQALVELAQGGAQPAPAAPEGQAPVYKKGGRLSYWAKK